MNFFKRHKVFTTTLVLLLVILLGGFAYVWFKLDLIDYNPGTLTDPDDSVVVPKTDEDDDQVVDTDGLTEADIIRSEDEIFQDSDVFNILLLGTDERYDDYQTYARADSIMILSLNHKTGTMKLVSIQRGTGVEILDGEYEGEYDWITHCFEYGGADLMLKEVREFYKVDVERYVRVNFNTFEQIINALGGVDIELTELEAQGLNGEVYTNARTQHTVYEGLNHLDGYDALQYARLRYIDSDWQRIQRQRNVIQSVVKSLKDTSLLDLNSLADEILPLVQTNLTKTEILSCIAFAPNVIGQEFEQMSVPVEGSYGSMVGMEGRILYAVDFDENADVLREFLYGTSSDSDDDSDSEENDESDGSSEEDDASEDN